jgi:hypothetical protein
MRNAHKALSLLASPLGPRPVPNADDRAKAAVMTDQFFADRLPSYDTPDRRRDALKWFAEGVMVKRLAAEHRARFEMREAAE